MVRGSVSSVLRLCDACSHLLFHEVRVELAEAVDLAWSPHPTLSQDRTKELFLGEISGCT